MTTLTRLPEELTIMISSYFPGEDFLRFLHTCRAIKDKINPLFIKRYFHTRHVMMESRSLENLTSISQSNLSPFVEALEICVDHYVKKYDEHYEALNEEVQWYWLQALSKIRLIDEYREYSTFQQAKANSNGNTGIGAKEIRESFAKLHKLHNIRGIGNIYGSINQNAYSRYLKGQEALLGSDDVSGDVSGDAASSLSSAMLKLRNCKTVTISESKDVRPWGTYLMAREIGVLPCRSIGKHRAGDDTFIQSLIHAVLKALFAGGTQLEEFGIRFGYFKSTGGFVGPQLLEMPTWLRPPLQVQLTTLTRLRLMIDPESLIPGRNSWEEHLYDDNEIWGAMLINFINLFPSLLTLGLHFSPYDKSRFPNICSNLSMPKLRRIELFGIECAATDLTCFLTSQRQTVKEISLERINLSSKDGDWRWLLFEILNNFHISDFYMDSCWFQNDEVISTDDNSSKRFHAKDQQELVKIIDKISK